MSRAGRRAGGPAGRWRVCAGMLFLVLSGLLPAPLHAQLAEPARVVPVFVLPSDYDFDARRLVFDLTAVTDVQAWYGRALDGVTFMAEPLIVRRSRHAFTELADSNFQAWWPLLGQEFADLGRPWNDTSDIKLLLLVHGAGAWAGADSENGGLARRTDAGRVPAGSLGGLVVIGDSSVGGLLAGVCPSDGVQRGTAWWCNWDTYRGTIAHELGHTFGLPHPDALRPPPDTTPRRWDCAVEGNTVLQCHWGFPYDSLLPYEREHLRSLRFFRQPADRGAFRLLAEELPAAVTAGARIRRPALAHAVDAGDGVVWVDDGPPSEGATGFPWAVTLPDGAAVAWTIGDGCASLALDAGRERGAGGVGRLVVAVDDSTLTAVPVGPGPPARHVVPVCGPGLLRLSASGEARFRAVVGNPRLY